MLDKNCAPPYKTVTLLLELALGSGWKLAKIAALWHLGLYLRHFQKRAIEDPVADAKSIDRGLRRQRSIGWCWLVVLILGLVYLLWGGTMAVAAGTAAQSPIRLYFWTISRDRGVEAIIHEFEVDHPGVKIVASPYDGGTNGSQRLATAIMGGAPPNIVYQDRFTIGQWASLGAFYRLNHLIRQSMVRQKRGGPEGIDSADYYPFCWREASYEGGVYGIPTGTEVRVLFYNSDELRQVGLVNSQGRVVPPRTWGQLKRDALKLCRRNAAGDLTRLGFAPNYGNSWLYIYAFLDGGRFMNRACTRCTMDSPPVVKALAYMARLYRLQGGINRVNAFVNAGSGAQFDPFLSGRLAMKIDGNWVLDEIVRYRRHLRFGVAYPPALRGHKSATWSGGFALVIPKTANHKRLSFDFIRFFVSQRGAQIYNRVNSRYYAARGRTYLPDFTAQPALNREMYRRYVLGNPNMPPRVAKAMHTCYELLKISHNRPVTPVGDYMWDQMLQAQSSVFRVGLSPQAALTRATRKVQRRLNRILHPIPAARLPEGLVMAALAAAALVLILAGFWREWRKNRLAQWRRSQTAMGWVFAGPAIAGFLIFSLGPMVASLLYSFCRYNLLHTPRWVGMENYQRVFVGHSLFWYSLANTAYMLIGVPAGMAVGLALAMLLNTEVRGIRLYRTIFYLPAVVPAVAAAYLWMWILNPVNGLLNSLLRDFGVANPPLWLNSPSWLLGSKAGIILMGLWGAGSGMIIWLAGLKGIPAQLYEAAKMDGAGPVRRFWNITLPMLTPYIFFNLIMGVIGTMQIFSQSYIMTSGGPDHSTDFYALYLFNQAFKYFRMGYASALAWILLLLILALTAIQFWLSRKWVNYDVV